MISSLLHNYRALSIDWRRNADDQLEMFWVVGPSAAPRKAQCSSASTSFTLAANWPRLKGLGRKWKSAVSTISPRATSSE